MLRGDTVTGERAGRSSLPTPFIDSEQTLAIVFLDLCLCAHVCVFVSSIFVFTHRYPVLLYGHQINKAQREQLP